MTESPHTHFGTVIRVAFFGLLALLAILCGLLFHQYRVLREEAFVNGHMHLFNPRGGPVHSTDVSLIQSWMTYDYVGHVYGLPINYLKTTLSITDPNYPHVTISNSAGALHENADALTAQVRSAVTHYFVAPTP